MSGRSADEALGVVLSVNVSAAKGERKTPVPEAELVVGSGILGDAHAGPGLRQISLLALESFASMPAESGPLAPGDFAENLTTRGIHLLSLPVGTRVLVGPSALLEISQHGKRCHSGCQIAQRVGTCVMPREGVFATVIAGGVVRPGDRLQAAPQLTPPVGAAATGKGA